MPVHGRCTENIASCDFSSAGSARGHAPGLPGLTSHQQLTHHMPVHGRCTENIASCDFS
jgi:hypothetical protein